MAYVNKYTEEEISNEDLPYWEQRDYVKASFLDSLIITGSALLGGDILGGVAGDFLDEELFD